MSCTRGHFWACLWATLCLYHSPVVGNADTNNTATRVALPDYTVYKNKSAVMDEVLRIVSQNPSSFRVDDVAAGDGEYATILKVVTVEPAGIQDDHSRKLRLFLDFGEHGRELVTVEVALRLLELLADPSAVEQMVAARGGNSQKLLNLLEHCVFKIIPMENVGGREIVEGGNLCERKNGRGVDSNRNWPVHWGFREKDYDPSEEYPGTKPFSEPEVQLLDRVAKEFEPHVWMNMHSGMEALFMPYDHLAAIPDDVAGKLSLELLQSLNTLKCGGRCAVGSGGKSVGYLAHGTATDYMHDVLGVPFSFTWEIYGDMSASFHDCFRMFNPLTSEHLEQVVSTWADAVLAMIELLPASTKVPWRGSQVHRKFLPAALAKDGQVYNHTDTDMSQQTREERLASIIAVVTEVEQALGLIQTGRLDFLSGIPVLAWVVLSCLAFLALGLLLGRGVLREVTGRTKARTVRKRREAVL